MEKEPKKEKVPLMSTVELFKRAWKVFSENFVILATILLMSVLAFAVCFAFGLFSIVIVGRISFVLMAILIAIMVAVYLGISIWVSLAFIWRLKERENKPTFKECFEKTSHLLIPSLWLQALCLFFTTGGLLFFVIPGIVFSVWFMFSQFILVVEDKRGLDALIRNRDLFKGYGIDVLKYLLILSGITIIPVFLVNLLTQGILFESFAQGMSSLSSIFFSVFSNIFFFLFFENLREVKKDEEIEEPSKKRKAKYVAVASLGFVLFLFATAVTIRGGLLKLSEYFSSEQTEENIELDIEIQETNES